LAQVTRPQIPRETGLGEAKSIHWKNEGLDNSGWLIYPRNFDPAKKNIP